MIELLQQPFGEKPELWSVVRKQRIGDLQDSEKARFFVVLPDPGVSKTRLLVCGRSLRNESGGSIIVVPRNRFRRWTGSSVINGRRTVQKLCPTLAQNGTGLGALGALLNYYYYRKAA